MEGRGALADRRWAVSGGLAGLSALGSYVALIALPVPVALAAVLTFGFGFGLTVASIGLHLAVSGPVAPRLSLLAVVANTVAAAQLVAMLLVQIAVKAAVESPGDGFTAIWLGLDVAWDLYVGAGTLLFALSLWHHPRFRPVPAVSGVVVGALLLGLNVATFPTPPGEAGLVDVGPLVGLWYLLVSVQVLRLARESATGALPD